MRQFHRLLGSLMLGASLVGFLETRGFAHVPGQLYGSVDDEQDAPECPEDSCTGMARWRISEPYLNLWIGDEPLGYNPSTGPRVSFLLSYQQRGTEDHPAIFNPGVFWNCSWRSYVTVTNGDTTVRVRFPSGGSSVLNADEHDYRTGAKLTTFTFINPPGFGWGETAFTAYQMEFPDGSKIRYTYKVTNEVANTVLYFMGDQADPTGQRLTFNYSHSDFVQGGGAKVGWIKLNKVVDADGRETTLTYNDSVGTNLIVSVTDPYSRTASLQYHQHLLTNITDVVGIKSGFAYETTADWGKGIREMVTPYGTTTFEHWPKPRPVIVPDYGGNRLRVHPHSLYPDAQGYVSYGMDMGRMFGVAANDTSRACLVTHPNGAKEYFAFFMNAGILTTNDASSQPVTMFPAQWPTGRIRPTLPINHLPVSDDTADTGQMNAMVSLHWTPRAYAQLGSSFKTAYYYSALTSADLALANLKQWLHDSPYALGRKGLNYERKASPDGTQEGHELWYDYSDKAANYQTGSRSMLRSLSETLPDGSTNVVFFERNELGNATAMIESWSVDADGPTLYRTNTYTYAANGVDLVGVTNAAGLMVAGLAYNSDHQVTYFTNASKEITTNVYNGRAQIDTVKTPAGLVVKYAYHTGEPGQYHLKKVYSQATHGTNDFVYDKGLVVTHTNASGLVLNYTWDALQRLTGVSFPNGTTISNIYERLDLKAQKDRLDRWTWAYYDPNGFLTRITNTLGHTVAYDHCDCGQLESVTDLMTNTTTFHYDNLGRRTWTAYPESLFVTNAYDVAGRLMSVGDQMGQRTFHHALHGPVSRIATDADGDLWKATFDPRDLVTNAVNRLGVPVVRRFDERGRLAAQALGGNPAELFHYGPAGLIAHTNENGGLHRTLFARDGLGRVVAETNANLEVTRYQYDGAGHLTNLVDGRSKKTSWEYDAYGLLKKKRDDDGNVVFTYNYDNGGRLYTRTTARAITTTYNFDDADQLTHITYNNGDPGVSIYYDDGGRLDHVVDALGTTTYGFDDLGRLESEDGPWASDTVAYGYTNRFRHWMTVAGSIGWGQTNGYDAAGRVRSIGSTAGQFTYGYNPATAGDMAYGLPTNLGLPGSLRVTNWFDSLGRLASTRLMNGTVALNLHQYLHDAAFQRTNQVRLDGSTVGYGYDKAGQLTSVTGKEAGGTVRQNEQLGYFYDAGGNLNRRTNNALVETFTVDSVNELDTLSRSGPLTVVGTVSPGTTSVSVNGTAGAIYADRTFAAPGVAAANGDNTFTVQSQDSLARSATEVANRYLPTSVACTYDADGNLTSDGLRSFSYDGESRLKTVWVTGQWRTDFVYDSRSRRRITTNSVWTGSAWSPTNVLYAIYDGMLLVQERTNASTPLVTYVRGLDLSGSRSGAGGIGGLLARVDHATPRMDLYHADGAGNVTALVSTNNAAVTARYLYDPFGTLLASSGPLAGANTMRFSSKSWQEASGLYDYGYRFYDPNLQRWLNRDPIQEAGGINLYGFVGNRPVNGVDPYGLSDFNRPPQSVSFECQVNSASYGPPASEPGLPSGSPSLSGQAELAAATGAWVFDAAYNLAITTALKPQELPASYMITQFGNPLGRRGFYNLDQDGVALRAAAAEPVSDLFYAGPVKGGAPLQLRKRPSRTYPPDIPNRDPKKNFGALCDSEAQARALARQKVGQDPVMTEDGKLRSSDGVWQYRAKTVDTENNHVHLEKLNPATGEVIANYHLYWPEGTER